MAASSQHRSRPHPKAIVVITEQPQSKALRFRYECEGRSAGSIPGVNSTTAHRTFPAIELRGPYKGRAVVVVSCVTKDPPYRPHPHSLVGKEGCKEGVCTVEMNSSTMSYTFSNLGIQCVKKKDIEDALKKRCEKLRVDPFKTGFGHSKQPATIDLNAIRLCFQVFVEGHTPGRLTEALQPVVSDVIYDKKAMSELVICKLSHVMAPTVGGKEIVLLCEKVTKEDISVRFYEEQDGKIVWEDVGEFQHHNVHKQVAICFRTPRYRTVETTQPVLVNIQLRRPSDGATSEPLPFELLPVDSSGALSQKRKRPKFSSSEVFEQAQTGLYNQMLPTPSDPVKPEPREQPFNFQGPYRSPNPPVSPAECSPALPNNENRVPFADATNSPAYNQAEFYSLGNNHQQYNGGAGYNYPRGNQGQQYNQPNRTQCQYMAAGPSGLNFQQSQQASQLPQLQPEYNLSSLLDMDIGRDFAMNSSEIKSIMGHFNAHGDPYGNHHHHQQQQQQHQQASRMQQDEEENLSNSFTRLTTNPLNDLNK